MLSGLHCGGGFCCCDDVLLVSTPLGCLRIFIIGCHGFSCGNGWHGGTIGNPIVAVVPKDSVPINGCSFLVGVGCLGITWAGGGCCCLCCGPSYPLGHSPIWGCLACPPRFLPPLIVKIIFLSKSFMRWRRVCRVTPSSLVGIFFHFKKFTISCYFLSSSRLVMSGGRYVMSTSNRHLWKNSVTRPCPRSKTT